MFLRQLLARNLICEISWMAWVVNCKRLFMPNCSETWLHTMSCCKFTNKPTWILIFSGKCGWKCFFKYKICTSLYSLYKFFIVCCWVCGLFYFTVKILILCSWRQTVWNKKEGSKHFQRWILIKMKWKIWFEFPWTQREKNLNNSIHTVVLTHTFVTQAT